jgi:hypothetical protein
MPGELYDDFQAVGDDLRQAMEDIDRSARTVNRNIATAALEHSAGLNNPELVERLQQNLEDGTLIDPNDLHYFETFEPGLARRIFEQAKEIQEGQMAHDRAELRRPRNVWKHMLRGMGSIGIYGARPRRRK